MHLLRDMRKIKGNKLLLNNQMKIQNQIFSSKALRICQFTLTLLSRQKKVQEEVDKQNLSVFHALIHLYLSKKDCLYQLTKKQRLILYTIQLIITTRHAFHRTFLRNTLRQVSLYLLTLLDMPVTFHKKIKSSGYGG